MASSIRTRAGGQEDSREMVKSSRWGNGKMERDPDLDDQYSMTGVDTRLMTTEAMDDPDNSLM
jgi:hypothetical protein